MTSNNHPVIKTLGFLCAVGLFTMLWMNRPDTPAFDLLPFPKWDDFMNPTQSALQPEYIDTLLVAYDSYARVDSNQSTLHSAATRDTIEVQLSPSIQPKDSFQSPPKGAKNDGFMASGYRHEFTNNSLHPNLQLQMISDLCS